MLTFIEQCLTDPARVQDIDKHIDAWHKDVENQCFLHDYLGMSWEEYQLYAGKEENLVSIIEKRKTQV